MRFGLDGEKVDCLKFLPNPKGAGQRAILF
jgi:hypothetical protein